MFQESKNYGFTLIELLVVVAIIALLSTIIMTTLDQAQGQARDSRRIAEIEELIKAIEMYKIHEGHYPGEGDTDGAQISPNCSSDLKDDLEDMGAEAVPEDPIDNLDCSETGDLDEKFFYAWDAETSDGKYCIGINRLETDWGVNMLADKYPDKDGSLFTPSCYGVQYSVAGGGDANFGIGTGGDFNYCFKKP